MASIKNLCAGRVITVPGRNALYKEMIQKGYLAKDNYEWSDAISIKCGSTPFETWAINVFNFEGGFVNNPNDKGGATNKGITLKAWQFYAPKLFNIPGTIDTLRNITETQALAIAKAYWDASGAPLLNYEAFQIMTAEMNWGTATKAIPLQTALNNLGVKVAIDGQVGPATAKAVNDYVNPQALWDEWMKGLEIYWRTIPKNDPSQSIFLAGWLRRLYETRAYITYLYPIKKKVV